MCVCVCVHIKNPDFHHTSGRTFISELNKKLTLNILYNDYEFSSIFNNYPSNSDYEKIDIFAMRYILIIVASNIFYLA